jgi:hypothetical protein
MDATRIHALAPTPAKADSLRSTPAGAIWEALPVRDQHLLLWLLSADIVTAQLAALLIYGHLRTAQRRLARLAELGILRSFWAANMHRPRGRHAYMLTRQARTDIERISWPTGRPDRARDVPPSAVIHQLATHDLLAAFVRAGDPLLREGIFAWVPERACAQLFDGYLRPDAVAGVRVGNRAIALFIERDLGSERGEVLAEKVRRYRSVFARAVDLTVQVGFVVESDRRARTVHEVANRGHATASGPVFLTAVVRQFQADPLGLGWTDGREMWSTRGLISEAEQASWPILTPGCLVEADAIAALDDRALGMIPSLHAFIRGSGA